MKTGKGNIQVDIKEGQFIFGRESAARELQMRPSSVRNRMVKLSKLRNLDVKVDKQFSIVTICNWGAYRELMFGGRTGNRTGKGQAKDTDNNVNNENNKKIQEIFAHFLLKTQKTYSLTNERRSIIEGRLREGRTVGEMKRAIDNFARDDWEGREKYIDIIYCLGKQRGKPDNFDKWQNCKPAQEAPGKGWAK
ncbi:MAG: hypothetical protein KJ706_03675 [Candidatus Omnitrophica bacterium]|nr:hypothetical protein [Candidatus Omnitrophota bacterium]